MCDLEEKYIYSTLCNDMDRPGSPRFGGSACMVHECRGSPFLFCFSSH